METRARRAVDLLKQERSARSACRERLRVCEQQLADAPCDAWDGRQVLEDSPRVVLRDGRLGTLNSTMEGLASSMLSLVQVTSQG